MRFVLALVFGILFITPVHAGPPSGSAYLDGGQSKVAVILCHGRAKHPRWKVVDPLRKAVHRELGYHTLSLQLPNANKKWKKYAEDFPKAYRTIEEGIAFVRKEKGVENVYLMGHSMGSRMAAAYLAAYPDSGVTGFIGVGVRNSSRGVLNSAESLRRVQLPVLDVWGTGGDGKDAVHAKRRSDLFSRKGYSTVVIKGANHTFDGKEPEMTAAVLEWLKGRN